MKFITLLLVAIVCFSMVSVVMGRKHLRKLAKKTEVKAQAKTQFMNANHLMHDLLDRNPVLPQGKAVLMYDMPAPQ